MKASLSIIAALCLMLCAGCYSEKKAIQQTTKAYTFYPATVADLYSKWFPIKSFVRDSIIYKQGETIWLPGDTVTIDCDSVLAANKGGSNKVNIPCPPCPTRVDTFYQSRSETQESTAGIVAIQGKLEAKDKDLIAVKEKLAAVNNTKRILWWAVLLLAAYTLTRWVLRIWGIKLP